MKKIILLFTTAILFGCHSSNAVYYPIIVTDVKSCTWRDRSYGKNVQNCYVEGVVENKNLIIKGKIFTDLYTNDLGMIRCDLQKSWCDNEIIPYEYP